MVTSYLIAAVVLIAFRYVLIRMAPPLRRYLDPGPWGDALAYFIQIQYYRKHSGAELDTRCLFRGKSLHTPSYYHRFVSRIFSDTALWARPWLPNLVLYALSVVAMLALSALVLPSDSLLPLVALSLVFIAQADNSRFDDQSVHYLTIQPRLLGAFALSLHSLLFAVMPSPEIALIGGSLALLIAVNTSVFSRQVAYFAVPLQALLAWDAIPLINLAVASALSLAFNREEFIESFRAHWRYASWYFKNFYQPREGSGLSYLIRRSLAPPVKFLPRYADTAIAAVLLGMLLMQAPDAFARRALAAIGGALIVCAFTATRKFASLGECGRYLSFSCWFLTPLAIVYALPRLDIPWAVAFAVAGAVLLRNIVLTMRGRGDLSNPVRQIEGLLDSAFAGKQRPGVWWSAHYRYGSIPLALGCGQATFEIQGTDLSGDVMAGLFARYPFLHNTEEFFDKHRVTHLLISKAEWPQEVYGPLDRVVATHTLLAEDANYLVMARGRG